MTIRLFGCLTKVCCGPCPDTYTIEAWEICGAAGSPCASYGLWMPKPSTGAAAGANKATITYTNCAGGGSVALPIRTYHVIPAYGCESSPHEGAWLGGAWSSCDTCSMANPLPGTLVHVTSVAFSYDPALAGGTDPEQLLAVYTYSESGGDAPGTTEAPHPACPAGGALGFAGITNNIAVMGSSPTASNGPWPCSVQAHTHLGCTGGSNGMIIALDRGSESLIESAVGPVTGVSFQWQGGAEAAAHGSLYKDGSCTPETCWLASLPPEISVDAIMITAESGLRLYHISQQCHGLRALIIAGGPAISAPSTGSESSGPSLTQLNGGQSHVTSICTPPSCCGNGPLCGGPYTSKITQTGLNINTSIVRGWKKIQLSQRNQYSISGTTFAGATAVATGWVNINKTCNDDNCTVEFKVEQICLTMPNTSTIGNGSTTVYLTTMNVPLPCSTKSLYVTIKITVSANVQLCFGNNNLPRLASTGASVSATLAVTQ